MSLSKTNRCALAVFLVTAAALSRAQAPLPRFPLTSTLVSAALEVAGLRVTPAQIVLPLQLATESEHPVLHVIGAELVSGSRLRIRLACNSNRDCQPFFALVERSSTDPALNFMASLPSSSAPDLPIRTGTAPGIRAGQHATLLMEDDHMRISVPIISIDSGAVGKEVRVSSLDRKTTYQATVLGPQMVRGSLP